MKKLVIFVTVAALIGSSLACKTLSPGSAQGQYESVCRDAVAGINALTQNLKLPDYFQKENPVRRGDEFDPNRYFKVLTHLKIQDGFTLDYVYANQGIGSQPLLYVRPVNQKPFLTEKDYRSAKPSSFLLGVAVDDSPEGFLQYATLALMGAQFYLNSHAGHNDTQVLCASNDIAGVISQNSQGNFGYKFDATLQMRAQAISLPGPAVMLKADQVTVSLLMFTKWGGFFRRTYTIKRAFPHEILNVENETLVQYDCGAKY